MVLTHFKIFRILFVLVSLIVLSLKLNFGSKEYISPIYSILSGLSIGFLFGMLTMG